MDVFSFICGFAVAFVLAGLIIGLIFSKRKAGTILVDQSDPDDYPQLFLELNMLPEKLPDGRFVVCKVMHKNYISHK